MKNILHNKNKAIKISTYLTLYTVTVAILYVALFASVVVGSNDFPVVRSVIVFFATVLLVKYFVYMFVSPVHNIYKIRHDMLYGNKRYNPLVSVIIPAWNEEVGILTTVKSILYGTYKNVEVLVINDGSTDESHLILDTFAKQYMSTCEKGSPVIRYAYKENGGKGHALNFGVTKARGDIIVSIDADCLVDQNAVLHFVHAFKDPHVMAAVGNVKIGNTDTLLGMIQYLEFLFSFYFKKADSVLGTIYIIGGAAGAFRKEVFQNLGHYNTTNITEDIEISMRIQDAGYKVVYVDDAIIYTEGATTFSGLLKQRLRWKRGRFQTFRQYKHMFFSVKNHHNIRLTCIALPLALFSELQMFGEPFFLIFLYMYSVLTQDFTSFISGIIVVSSMFVVQLLFEKEADIRFEHIGLVPIGWLLFYVASFVEFNALIKSMWYTIRRREVVWQKWERVGVAKNNNK